MDYACLGAVKKEKMYTNRKTSINESKMKITASTLMRLAGLAAMGAGILYVAI